MQKKNQAAFQQTENHKGLTNQTGENNCFLNVTIQALWHLGPFRCQLQQLIRIFESERSKNSPFENESMSLLSSLCNLFTQYEFTDQKVLPPNELRESLGKLSSDYELGKIADATETLDTILQRIHLEFHDLCPAEMKCLSHATFGGMILEQTICHLCGASSEPTVRNSFLMYFQSAEILEDLQYLKPPLKIVHEQEEHSLGFFNLTFLLRSSKEKDNHRLSRKEIENMLKNEIIQAKQFAGILKKCMMAIGKRSCPSNEEEDNHSKEGNLRLAEGKSDEKISESKSPKSSNSHQEKSNSSTPRTAHSALHCKGEASVFFFSLDPPLILALSVGWASDRESSEHLLKFYSLISSSIYLNDLFSEDIISSNRKMPSAWRSVPSSTPTNKDNTPVIDVVDEKQSLSALQEQCKGPSYVFRGMVCYYGKHYVSIFLDSVTSDEETYLLFDDHRVRPIGSWEQAVKYCVSSLYQPVLLLYELEKNSAVYSMDRIKQDYSHVSSHNEVHSNNKHEQHHPQESYNNTSTNSNRNSSLEDLIKLSEDMKIDGPPSTNIRNAAPLSPTNLKSYSEGSTTPIFQILSIDTNDGTEYSEQGIALNNDYNTTSTGDSPYLPSPSEPKTYRTESTRGEKDRQQQGKKSNNSPFIHSFPSPLTRKPSSYISPKESYPFDDNNSYIVDINENKNTLFDDTLSEEENDIRKRNPLLTNTSDLALENTKRTTNASFWKRFYEQKYNANLQGAAAGKNQEKKEGNKGTSNVPQVTGNALTKSNSSKSLSSHQQLQQLPRNNSNLSAKDMAETRKKVVEESNRLTTSSQQSALNRNLSAGPSLYSLYSFPDSTTTSAHETNLKHLSTKFAKYNVQSVITVWGRRPFRYHISLPLQRVNYRTPDPAKPSEIIIVQRLILGIILDCNEIEEIFITDFYRHPVTNEILAAEAGGKIQLMDQLIAINGELACHLRPVEDPQSPANQAQHSSRRKLHALHQVIEGLQEPFILFEFQSSIATVLWFQCPNCSFTNEITPEREESLKKQLMDRIKKRKIRKNDNSNTHSVDNYGIYFTCKFCQMKSLCPEYLPDLSSYA
jgi:hypothetical protein